MYEMRFTCLFPKTWTATTLKKVGLHNWSSLKRHPYKWTAFPNTNMIWLLSYQNSRSRHTVVSVRCHGWPGVPEIKWNEPKSRMREVAWTGDGHMGHISSACASFGSSQVLGGVWCVCTLSKLSRVVWW